MDPHGSFQADGFVSIVSANKTIKGYTGYTI